MGRPVAILTRQLTVYRRSLELLRRQLTVEALLVAFTAVDAVGVVIVLQLAQAPAVGLADAGLAMAIALFGFWRRGSAAIRGPALAVLVLLLLALPQLVLISEQTVNSPLHDGILLTDAAGERLLAGLDPYGHDYLDSAARTFYLSDAPVNFGLRHYVYMPRSRRGRTSAGCSSPACSRSSSAHGLRAERPQAGWRRSWRSC
jgi:hypothetical protein